MTQKTPIQKAWATRRRMAKAKKHKQVEAGKKSWATRRKMTS